MYKKLILAMGPLLMAASAVQAAELSVWAGQLAAKSDDIPYLFDENTNQVITTDLGSGNAFGFDFSTEVAGWMVGAGFASSRPASSDGFDSNPAAANDCNLLPVQGIEGVNCFDHANIEISTTVQTLDLTVGKRYVMNWASLTPYGGIRQLTFDQSIDAGYRFPGILWEQFPKRTLEYSGYGPRVGVRVNTPRSRGKFFFDGDVAMATMMSSSRSQSIVERVTLDGATDHINTASSSSEISPVIIDLSLMVGYKVSASTSIGLGYRHQSISDVIDSRETNEALLAPDHGSANADLELSGVFARADFQF
jgi:hypothetical protein